MRFIKLFFTFMAVLLLIPCGVQSQNTAPMPTTFEILKPADRMVYSAPGETMWKNSYGSPVRWVSADDDSVGSYLKDVERHWKIGIVSIGALSPDTGDITVTVHTRDPRGEDLILPYTATLNAHQQIEVNNPNWIPGISIMMDDSVTALYAPGDTFEIVYLRRSFNPHTTSRLTVKTTRDTFLYATGAVATDWFSADDANLTALLKLGTPNTSTGAQVSWGYQLSMDKVTTLLPLDDATALNDSVTAVDADVTGRRDRWNYHSFTHPICKWMRLLIFGKNSTGRVWSDSIDVITAN